MNVVIPMTQHAKLIGLADGFLAADIPLVKWMVPAKSCFDLFDECSPSLLFFAETEASPQVIQALSTCLQEFKATKFIWIGNNVPDTLTPDLVCVDKIPHENPRNLNFHQIDLARNSFSITQGTKQPGYEIDILVLSYQQHSLDSVAMILSCISPNSIYSCRIIGGQQLSVPQYVGEVDARDMGNMIASSKVCLDISGRHLYDIIYQRSFPITSLPNKLVTPQRGILTTHLERVFKDEEYRQKTINQAYDQLEGNTYFDRTYEVVKLLKEPVLIGKFDEARNSNK